MGSEAKVCVGTNPNSLVAQGLDFKGQGKAWDRKSDQRSLNGDIFTE